MIRVGNCSGFYGDRLSAMREMLEDGDLDYLTGDWLAELTMLILGKDTFRDPSLGYARTFLTQVTDCLELALTKGVKIVSNAGGLNPRGLAEKIDALGTGAKIAYVDGDDLSGTEHFPGALTANAYLGAFGIAEALTAGADIVVTGRVTDAAVVMGPAIAAFGWTKTDYDRLAGAVVAGHVIECGTQVTGGNFSGFLDIDFSKPLGFPIAEIAEDGSCVITKHAGTGGNVTVDTVTAQLMYEIQGAAYLNPDVTTDLSSIQLAQLGPDRVEISGTKGSAAPDKTKVAVNNVGGYRNMVEFVLTGLDIEAKGALIKRQIEAVLPEGPRYSWTDFRTPAPDSPTEEGAAAILRLIAWSDDEASVSKAFTGPIFEQVLASYPGFHVTAPPGKPSIYGVYTPGYVPVGTVSEQVHLLWLGSKIAISAPESALGRSEIAIFDRPTAAGAPIAGPAVRTELGRLAYARSGDKGGDANVGLWIPQGKPDAAVDWLLATVTQDWIKGLIPEATDLAIDIVALPNLRGVNVVIHGWLGAGVAEQVRFDPQAKALGEWLRARYVDIPETFLGKADL